MYEIIQFLPHIHRFLYVEKMYGLAKADMCGGERGYPLLIVVYEWPQFNAQRFVWATSIIYTVRCGRCNGQAGDADIAASYVCIFYFSFSGSKTSLDRNSNNEHTICAEQSLCITNLLIELTQSPETIQEESCRQQTSCTVLKIGSKARKKLS